MVLPSTSSLSTVSARKITPVDGFSSTETSTLDEFGNLSEATERMIKNEYVGIASV